MPWGTGGRRRAALLGRSDRAGVAFLSLVDVSRYHPTADEQQAIYRRAFVNLPFANGDNSWELPIPATFVVGCDGTVLYASADEDYTERPEPSEIVRQLSHARGAKPAS